MSLLDRIFQEPELRAAPPVLVDIGAAGGVAPVWRTIARHSIGVGFEPDARDAARLGRANGAFGRWIYCEGLVAPTVEEGGRKNFNLTHSPHCSSLLKPRADRLHDWVFADFFKVEKVVAVSAVTLPAALAANGLDRVDWLKCDTQGLDLGIFLSLPPAWRQRLLAVDFEPGLIDAYEGEDKLADVLAAMEREPFWLAQLDVVGAVRGRRDLLARHLGPRWLPWVRRLAPTASAWGNLRYLRDFTRLPDALDRRAWLLGWVFATLLGQHGSALDLAEQGGARFGGDLFPEMARASVRHLRRSMLLGMPGWLWRRLTGRP